MKTVKELCKEYGYSQTALAKRFGIPLRTVQDWHSERRNPPPWVVPMIEEILKAERDAETKVTMVAEWEKYGYKWRCTACGRKVNIDGTPEENGLYFCSGCGAKMKEYER